MSSLGSRASLPPPGDEFMLDIDKIIFTNLKNAGYPIKPEIRSVKGYVFDEVVNMVLFCLRILLPEKGLPESLPYGMHNRYLLSTQIVESMKQLKYPAEIGYHIFMYSNKDPIRNVLIFLTDELPGSGTSSTLKDKDSKKATTKQKVVEELMKIMSKKNETYHPGLTSTPFISLPLETGIILPAQKIDCKPIEWKEFVTQKLPYIDDQLPDGRCFLPSVLSLNATGLRFPKREKKSNISSSPINKDFLNFFSNSLKLEDVESLQTLATIQENEASPGDSEILTENSIKLSETEKAVVELEIEVDEMKPRIEQMSRRLEKIKVETQSLQGKLDEKLSHQSALEQSINLLPNSEANIEKLTGLIEKTKGKLDSLNSQTENHRQLLLNKRKTLQKTEDEKMATRDELMERISQIRTEIFNIVEQINHRKVIYERLENRVKSLQGDDRSIHVQRIIVFIENLKKQEAEILKILSDMRSIQKSINVESEKVDRCFSLTSQLIYSNATSDDFSSKAYRLFTTINKLIEDIIQLDSERVNLEKRISEVEYELMNRESSDDDALKDIKYDLALVERETKSIENQIRVIKERLNRGRLLTEEESKSVADSSVISDVDIKLHSNNQNGPKSVSSSKKNLSNKIELNSS